MKRWAALTVLVYLAALAVLAVPLLMLLMGPWPIATPAPLTFPEALQVFQNPGFFIWLGLMGVAQAVLLFVPVGKLRAPPRKRRQLLYPVITAGLCLANLLFCGVLSICAVIFRDAGFDWLGVIGKPLANGGGTASLFAGAAIILALFWVGWGLVFYFACRRGDADAAVTRAVAWMLKGSVAELLVAVPTHVIVRRRDDCCAPAATFWGIVTGLSVLLLAFGPGIYFLFARRAATLRRESAAIKPNSG